jgi:uncharacterized protein YegJ (DUF2314 family)
MNTASRLLIVALLLTVFAVGAACERSSESNVTNVSSDDQAMNDAMARSREQWPEFVKLFVARTSDHVYLVKVTFSEPGVEDVEYMWVQATSADADSVGGVLTNEPLQLRSVKRGDTVQKTRQDVADWVVLDAKTSVAVAGDFTGPIIRAINEEK